MQGIFFARADPMLFPLIAQVQYESIAWIPAGRMRNCRTDRSLWFRERHFIGSSIKSRSSLTGVASPY